MTAEAPHVALAALGLRAADAPDGPRLAPADPLVQDAAALLSAAWTTGTPEALAALGAVVRWAVALRGVRGGAALLGVGTATVARWLREAVVRGELVLTSGPRPRAGGEE